MYLAAPSAGGAVFGAVGAGGISLVLAALLVLGVKGKGKVKLKDNPAVIFAFLAGTAFSAAGKIWANPERLISQGLTGLGVGTGSGGAFGDVGVGAVCLLLVVIILCAPLSPGLSASLGLISAVVFPLAGDSTIWAAPVELAMAILAMVAA
ncbi:hypothetical protein [Streptomyces pacificus]|uniref:Uncharacterized protein n=1 Tax=Streptomyces pacificus TaxID=2705029 RepID=A0A6A0AUR1_9ACTN|nr:hypothetical protein [Streptomyces pacificus]GFH36616.1 hypothetical protein SCWH03_28470 [Streptomyces pacificus]GFH38894.1 hypothetical protein SCWH03_51570 [Streptomyces pacificus]